MTTERRKCELWRDGDWRCEWWLVDERPQVRLYLGSFLVSDLAAGLRVDLQRQTELWRKAVHADRHRT